MTGKRRFPYRKLDETERIFIETRLERGHTPAAIRDTMNGLTRMTTAEIEKATETGRRMGGARHTIWTRFSGREPYTIEDVRRAYDRLRKSKRPADVRHNERRKTLLMQLQLEEDNRNAIAAINPNIPRLKHGATRKMVDAGMRYRLTEDAEALELIEDYYGEI